MTALYWTGVVVSVLCTLAGLGTAMAKKDPTGSDVAGALIAFGINVFMLFLLVHAAVNS